MTVFKTFFWTSVIWALALVGLWFGADYEPRIAETWAKLTPKSAYNFLTLEQDFPASIEVQPESIVPELEEPKAEPAQEQTPITEETLQTPEPTAQEEAPSLPDSSEALTEVLENPALPAVENLPANNAELTTLQEQLTLYKWRAEMLESYVRILLNEKAERN